jgi:MFS family permease
LLTAGSLADMYDRRLMYLIGLVVFTCASALRGFAASTLMLQLSRALQGAGGAIMFAVSLALLADAFRGKDRGVAFGPASSCCRYGASARSARARRTYDRIMAGSP